MALLHRYDKFTYSHQRNNSEREVVSPSSPGRKHIANEHNNNIKNKQSSTDLYIHHDPSASVLNPLRHGAYSFAIAEDGILHSRIVAPPRICYAPVISELDVPHAMPQTPWQRLNAILINSLIIACGGLPSVKFSDANNDSIVVDGALDEEQQQQQHADVEVLSSSASVKAMNRARVAKLVSGGNNNELLDFESIGGFEWEQIEQAIKLLEKEDAERDEALVALLASSDELHQQDDDEGANNPEKLALEKGRRLAFYKEKKETFDTERVTSVDKAKIELIWKKARMMTVNVEAKRTAERARAMMMMTNSSTSLSRKNSQNRLVSNNNNNISATTTSPLLAKKSSGSGFSNNRNPEMDSALDSSSRRNPRGGNSSRPSSSSRGSSPVRALSQGSNKSVGRESSNYNNNNNNATNASVFGARGTIFNERLKWTNKPKVDSNNNTNK